MSNPDNPFVKNIGTTTIIFKDDYNESDTINNGIKNIIGKSTIPDIASKEDYHLSYTLKQVEKSDNKYELTLGVIKYEP